MDRFRAVVIERSGDLRSVALRQFDEAELMPGDVSVRVTHSSLNYKDGLALSGRAPVVRRFPMIPGIDLAGVVERSDHPGFSAGDRVLLNGCGLGETHLGGFAERARVDGNWLLPLPPALSAAEAMAVGTAGLTAALSVLALERHGLRPDAGPAVVTGAAGGVGSIAVALLAKAGWRVVACSGRAALEAEYLRRLGAAELMDRAELDGAARPLGREDWAAAIDSVGSATLANLLSRTAYGGAVAACGLASGADLPGFVAPFILRGVSLLGIDSVRAPMPLRTQAWSRIASDLDRALLAGVTTSIPLDAVQDAAAEILAGRIRGRVVVEIAPERA